MPPSAITGVSVCLRRLDGVHDRGELRHADAGDDPGGADRARPDPDLDRVGAGIDQRLGALGGGDVAGNHLHRVRQALDAGHGVEHAPRMAVRGIDDDEIDAGVDQRLAARIAGFADAGRGGDAQPALLVLAGIGIRDRFLDVLHGDQADAAVIVIDDQELLDAVLMQEALGFVLADALAHRDELVLGHQLGHLLPPVGGKAHVAIGEDADELAGASVAAALDHRDAGDVILLHQRQRVGERRVGMDGDRIHHHARFEFLHLPHLRRLHGRIEIAVNDADAAGLRHGDRHVRLGHGIHGRGDDRDVERDAAGDARADIDLGRQHIRQAGLDQHVVEGQALRADCL